MLLRLTVVLLLSMLCPLDLQAQTRSETTTASSTQIHAQPDVEERSWSAGISLGAGQRSNPLLGGDAIDLWWSVDFAWYGERWFFDNGDLGFMLRDTRDYTINWIARVNTERAFFSELNEGLFQSRVPIGVFDPVVEDPQPAGAPAAPDGEMDGLNGSDGEEQRTPGPTNVEIPDRDYAIESGLEFLRDDPFGSFHAQLLADVSGVHKGYELWLNYSTDFVLQRWHFVPSVSLSWKSKNLNDYYFGVRADEAVGELREYSASSGLNASIKLSARYYISENWTVALVADYERLNNSASDSPLLKDNYIASYFAGVHYAF